MPRSFRVENEQTIYEDRFRRFTRADIYRDDKKGEYTFIYLSDFVGALPLTPDGETVIIKTYRFPLQDYLWEFSLGGVDAGEQPLEAALRELREETGIITEQAVPMPMMLQSPGLTNRKFYPFIAPVNKQTLYTAKCPQNMDEIVDLRIVSLDEVGAMIDRGDFPDLPSVMMYAFARQYMERLG